MNRIPDRIDTPPEQPRFIEGVKPAFAPNEVLENFEGYAKTFHEIVGGVPSPLQGLLFFCSFSQGFASLRPGLY